MGLPRFSLASLMWLVTCVSCCLGTHLRSHKAGFSLGFAGGRKQALSVDLPKEVAESRAKVEWCDAVVEIIAKENGSLRMGIVPATDVVQIDPNLQRFRWNYINGGPNDPLREWAERAMRKRQGAQ